MYAWFFRKDKSYYNIGGITALCYLACLFLAGKEDVTYFSSIWHLSLDYSTYKLLIAGLLLSLFYVLMERCKAQKLFVYPIFFFIFAPICVAFVLVDFSWVYLCFVSSCFFITIITEYFFIRIFSGKQLSLVKDAHSPNVTELFLHLVMYFILVLTFSYLVLFFNLNGLSAFTSMYKIRKHLHVSSFFNYLIRWTGLVILPYFVYYFHNKKSYFKALTFLMLSFILFFYLPFKTYLFLGPLALLASMYGNLRLVNIILIVSAFFLLIVFVSKNTILIALSDRAFYLPAYLNFQYYNFFSLHPFNSFCGSTLGHLFCSTDYYGGHYTRDTIYTTMNANTGYLGSAYAQFGYISMLLQSILLGFCFSLNKLVSGFRLEQFEFLFFLQVLFLINSDLVEIYFSNGFVLVLLFSLFLYKLKKNF